MEIERRDLPLGYLKKVVEESDPQEASLDRFTHAFVENQTIPLGAHAPHPSLCS